MIDPDDEAGFEELGLHGFDFDRHGDLVMSALGANGLGRALFCWRVEGHELVLEEISSKQLRRHLLLEETPDAFKLDGVRYLRRDPARPMDAESGLFCIGSAGLRHALASISFEPPVGVEAFAPLLLLDEEHALAAERIHAGDAEAAKARARASSASRCAYVHDGSSNGRRAVVAVASERGHSKGRTLLLRYRFEGGQVVAEPPVDSAPSESFW